MQNFHRGGSDHLDTACGASADSCNFMVDMSNPDEVRLAFPQHETKELNFSPDGESIQLDDPFATPANITEKTAAQAVDTESISQLTEESERILPVHSNGSYPDPAKWESLHEANVQRAKEAAQNGAEIVMFGDSITEAMVYNPDNLAAFQEKFGSENPTPLGLGGDGTAQLLYRINHGEFQGQPKVAMVMIGTNDIGSLSPSQIADNTQKIVDSIHARSPNTQVLVMGVLPRPVAGDADNSKVASTNQELSQLARDDGSVQFADINRNFVDGSGREIPQLYQEDGLHLAPAGYGTWAAAIEALIRRMLTTRDGNDLPPAEHQPDYSPGAGNGSGSGYDNGWQAPDHSSVAPGYENTGGDSYYSPDTPLEYPLENLPPGDGRITLDVANIRAVDLDGANWGKAFPNDNKFWPTAENLDYWKSKGMNTVRLGISWEQFQPTPNGPLDRNEMAQLHKFLQAAAERGIKVIPVLMNFDRYTLNHGPGGQGIGRDNGGTLVGSPDLPVSTLQDFWQKLVSEVNENETESSAIGGWDLMNEPYDTGGTWVNTATQVVKAIRATGDNHSIVVEGDQWARDFSGFEALAQAGQNVVFSAHSYWDSGSGAYDNVDPTALGPNVGIEKVRPFVDWLKRNNAKGFVGEWGVPTTDERWEPAIKNFIHYLTDNGIGNTVWGGGSAWEPSYKLGVEPNGNGDVPVLDAIVEANRYRGQT